MKEERREQALQTHKKEIEEQLEILRFLPDEERKQKLREWVRKSRELLSESLDKGDAKTYILAGYWLSQIEKHFPEAVSKPNRGTAASS